MQVSVVIPVYNEEKYIEKCIESLLCQTFPKSDMEWIFVDGCSKDQTKEILLRYQKQWPELIKILLNPNRTVPYAMNIGIGESVGTYIIRLDAHAEYPETYIEKCVHYLNTTDADNVGGLAETKGNSEMGKIISLMLSSKFGVGNSQFRINGKSGFVDTVPFGAFRRTVFKKLGGYDKRLTRNQDNEMNYRIRKNGGKIYLAEDIHFAYYARDTIKGILKMAFQNGKWNVITSRLCPGTMGIRHFIPMAFVVSLLFLIPCSMLGEIWKNLLSFELFLYGLLDIIFSIKSGEALSERLWLLFLFPSFHISYGIGSLGGVIAIMKKEFRINKGEENNVIIWKN